MHHLLERHPGVSLRQLGVGDAVVSQRPLAVSTVLGSCVAVTFHCPVSGWGAMFHALMPQCDCVAPAPRDYKFVDDAIRRLARGLLRQGVRRADLVCKVFGGANAMFAEQFGVGRRNVLTAFETLESERLRVAVSDVGGDRGRKLLFFTHTGEVFVKRLNPQCSLD